MEKIPTEVTHWVGSVLLFIYKSKTENRFFFSVHSNCILLFTKVFVLFFFPPPNFRSHSCLNPITSALRSFSALQPFVIKACPFAGRPSAVSPVIWRRGWSRILRRRRRRSASGRRWYVGGCLSDCWRTPDCCCFHCCCPRCRWQALASCSPASPTAPGRAERNHRAWSGSAAAHGLLMLTQRLRRRLQQPWPCYNAAKGIKKNNFRLWLMFYNKKKNCIWIPSQPDLGSSALNPCKFG